MPDLTQADWVALTTAAVGAFLGAGAAFLLEALRRWRSERRLRYASLMQAQFALGMQLNTLVNIDNQYLDGVREVEDRFVLLPPFHLRSTTPDIDFDALIFLATDDQIEVLQSVQVAQESFMSALAILEVRNRYVEETYAEGKPAGDFDFESGMGKVTLDARKARVLKGATDGLYLSVTSGIELEQDAIRALGKASKRMFPRRNIVRIEFAAKPESPPS